MMRYLKSLFIIAMLLAGAGPARAADPILVVGEADAPPYSFEENGRVKGIDYDILVQAARRMQVAIHVTLAPWVRMKRSIENGTCDAGFCMFYVKKREDFCIYVHPPLHRTTYSVFVRKGEEFPFHSIRDLFGKTVGKTRGYSISAPFDRAVARGRITVVEVNNKLQSVRMLAAGRIDGMVSYRDMTLAILKAEGVSGRIVPLPTPVQAAKGAYLVLSRAGKNIRRKKAFAARLNQVLEEMAQDGTFQRIYDTYLK